MKLFVTGATGFVGARFVAEAIAQGHAVVALRRPGSVPDAALPATIQWVEGALDADLPASVWHGVGALVHLAAHTANPPYDTLERCLYWNVCAALRFAEQARAAGVRHFVVAGSCFEYGPSAAGYEAIPVHAALEPGVSYATSKAAASIAFEGFAREHGLSLQILRIFHVYGDGEPASRLWPTLRRAALAGEDFRMTAGAQVRDFVEVGEVARQFVRALAFKGVVPGQPRVRHVGSGQARTLADFAQYWWRHWGAKGRLELGAVPYRPNEMMRLVPALDDAARGLNRLPASKPAAHIGH